MKFIIVFAALFAVALSAAVVDPSAHAEIVRYENDNIGLDHYNFDVQTSDGKQHSEEGVLKNVGPEHDAIVVTGQYSYVGDDGVTYTVHYVADENGFQPQGDHLPQSAH